MEVPRMRLTLSEIRNRAIAFGHDWKDETSERAEAQTFWNEFFNVFGINRRSVASFERTVKNLEGAYDRIDVIWQGVVIGEHKSRGKDLAKAATQAFGYVQSLTRAGRDSEIPRFIIVSDFARIELHDLENDDPLFPSTSFPVEDLHQYIRLFDFLNGIQSKPADPEDPINIQAVEVLGELHDALESSNYSGHALERLLVRVLFCLFADDTGIFEPDTFKTLVEESREDGSDLGQQLDGFFRALDTPEDKRPAKMPDALRTLPYVNGNLFTEKLDLAYFDAPTRDAMKKACGFQWAKISPAVFGSLFQSIMAGDTGAKKRRQIGAHYTSERDIMKLIRSLFLDDLRAEFEKIAQRKLETIERQAVRRIEAADTRLSDVELARLRAKRKRIHKEMLAFHDKLASLKFLDPACGCGNFLVVAYRELRRLELEVIDELYGDEFIDLGTVVRIDVDCMHGIEIEEWPARIAEVAMWLIDHQMNQEASQKFGKPLLRLPLKKSAKIEHANALRIDWNTVLPAKDCSFVMGNPPFVGKTYMTSDQEADVELIVGDLKCRGVLDYVTMWWFRATEYIALNEIEVAFVSTNSITQGEQASVLWPVLFKRGFHIHFAHRTFEWESEAKGKAHVHVVIVGMTARGRANANLAKLRDYSRDGSVTEAKVSGISPYLHEGSTTVIAPRSSPICPVPPMKYGSKPVDDQQLVLEPDEVEEILRREPDLKPYVRKFLGSYEFINGIDRYCLWLADAPASVLRSSPTLRSKLDKVRAFRQASKKAPTREKAEEPMLFAEIRQPKADYLAVPEVSSSTRPYVPIGVCRSTTIASNKIQMIVGSTRFHFGVLSSEMHMAWVRLVAGRLKSDFNYSSTIVYNNYPWPTDATDAQKKAVESAAQGVLDAREQFKGQTLADLYDPLAMPKALRDAHRALDRAVDKCYRAAPFDSDRQRVEFLFGLYEKLTSLYAAVPKVRAALRKGNSKKKSE
jgi:hypothetical protein